MWQKRTFFEFVSGEAWLGIQLKEGISCLELKVEGQGDGEETLVLEQLAVSHEIVPSNSWILCVPLELLELVMPTV